MNTEICACVFGAISGLMKRERNYLIELDQQNGDGDLGISMDNAFAAATAYLKNCGVADVGRALNKAADVFNEASPSSLGTILSFAIKGMARSLKAVENALPEQMASALKAGVDNIMEKAGSKPGEKTILDSLCPGVEALQKAISQGKSVREAVQDAAVAAAQGSQQTKDMRAVWGRAAYYGDKSIGLLDGGSVVGKLIFEGICQYYAGTK